MQAIRGWLNVKRKLVEEKWQLNHLQHNRKYQANRILGDLDDLANQIRIEKLPTLCLFSLPTYFFHHHHTSTKQTIKSWVFTAVKSCAFQGHKTQQSGTNGQKLRQIYSRYLSQRQTLVLIITQHILIQNMQNILYKTLDYKMLL